MKKALHEMFTCEKWGALAHLPMLGIKAVEALGERHYSGGEKQTTDIWLFKAEICWRYMTDNARRTHFALWVFFFLSFRSALEITVCFQHSICHSLIWFVSLCWLFMSWIIAVLSCFCCGFKNSFKGKCEKEILNELSGAWKASWDIKLLFWYTPWESSILLTNIILTYFLYIGTGPAQW